MSIRQIITVLALGTFIAALTAFGGAGGGTKQGTKKKSAKASTHVVYSCPMHPEVTSTKAGASCPKCGMHLVAKASATAKDSAKQAAVYSCPMHPEVTSDKPGSCPKCGMDLVKVTPEKKTK